MAKMRTIARSDITPEEFQSVAQQKRIVRMETIDRMPPDMRELVHAYGYTVVHTCQQLGVTKAKQIKHLVECILDEFSPTRGSHSRQGIRTEVHYE
jgi:hypothetical protein